MICRQSVISICLILFFQLTYAQPFPSSSEVPPAGYSGKTFQLSQDYPKCLAAETRLPWMSINFKTQPIKYVEAVYQYILEGNIECDWVGQENKVRKWYHAPWMHWNNPKDGVLGREFINGLTRERDSRPYELSTIQHNFEQNWAVGMYNSAGGYCIGEVWKDALNPNPSKAHFPYGTVCAKLLFTATDTLTAPYLKGSPIWLASIHANVNEKTKKTIKPLHLLQFDVAVRDPRADNETGWVFGTLIYDGDLPVANPWQRMVPAGAIWGNDKNITPEIVGNGETLKESFINPSIRGKFKYGWAGRLNGPVDNPNSSCISCHSTAEFPTKSASVPPDNASVAERLHWFRNNIKSGDVFTFNAISLDYSLQLAKGIEYFYLYKKLTQTAGRSDVWLSRLTRLISGTYIYILVLFVLLFYVFSKYANHRIILQAFISTDLILLILRFGIGIMFMVHGFSKIAGGPVTWTKLGQSMANMGIYFFPELWGFMATFAEFGGGLLMISGLFFRPALLMMLIHITIACLKHFKYGDSIETASHAVEIWFVFLMLFLSGPGKFSLDQHFFSKDKLKLEEK